MSAHQPDSGESPRPSPDSTINRSATDSAKGPILQRLRVALFLLEAIQDEANIQAYAAVEAIGDAYLATSTSTCSSAYSEEDKNYDEAGAFSFVSAAVINSVVLFIDQWLNWRYSSTLRFGLYATVGISKEKSTRRMKDLGICLPKKPILELLSAHDYSSDPDLLPCVISLVLSEYEAQYDKLPAKGHLSTLKTWTNATWIDFLSKISWLFSETDEAVARYKVVEAIKKCPFYTNLHEGKEEIISSALLDMFDEKQLASEFGDRFVHKSEVHLLFRKVASGEIRCADPTWSSWEGMQAPSDQRNIGEKLTAVCPTLSAIEISRYQRRTSAGLSELDAHSQDKNVLAMRYQIFDVCEGAISLLAANAGTYTPEQLNKELEDLTDIALARVSERASEYGYSYKTRSFVHGLMLELFDSCFLALDQGPT